MDEIYYLIHTTNNPECIHWIELKTAEFNTDDQFPGVYLTMITKYNINNEFIFPGKYIIILSKKLLFQKNYHMNLRDYNGIISENNTFFPWNLTTFIRKNKLLGDMRPPHEIIFHDNIDMRYCCGISIAEQNVNIKRNSFLPKITTENEAEPDMTKLPFFCYPFEDIYTGANPLPRSSNKWYEMITKVCNVDVDIDDENTENIIKKIKDKAVELYNTREDQNIDLLQEYTF